MHPSKILLFGEYTILLDSDALAMPYYRFTGELAFMDANSGTGTPEKLKSHNRLNELLSCYTQSSINNNLEYPIDLELFKNDLENGIYFKSDIPEGSGLGSSGALVAAIFTRYSKTGESEPDVKKLRNCLSLLESFFHGKSSGIDPLVSYLKSPLLIKCNEVRVISEHLIETRLREYGFFLVHGPQNGKTGELVKKFSMRCESDAYYLSKTLQKYIPVNNNCIRSLSLTADRESFFSDIKQLTRMQTEIFNEMIPPEIIPLINYGLEKNLYFMKLCGSGGGGFFLGFTENITETERYFNKTGYKIMSC
jgi:mevalonate kinase